MIGGQALRAGKLSFTTRYVLLFGVLLLVANTALGFSVLGQSRKAMKELINKNMVDVVKSAAGSLDGDVLGSLTEDDVDGPVFCDIEDRLLVFQNSVDIHYIYAVKQVDEDAFVFTVDPDPVDPGTFGEEIVTTPALVRAGMGIPTADDEPAADRWGNYYSAYCPVFDSSGKVAGIVGVDFDAQWYDDQIHRYSMSIVIVTVFSVVLGGVVVVLMTNRVRVKFRDLDVGLSDLSKDVDLLMEEMASYSGFEVPNVQHESGEGEDTEEGSDELEILSNKIRTMQTEMGIYLDYLHAQAYTDALTKVGNSAAYHELVNELNEQIAEGVADFWVSVYDINSLKELNDSFGHECGDEYIRGAARVLTDGFNDARVFRIGGDEFAVIAVGFDQERMEMGVHRVDEALEAFNTTEKASPALLALSQGMAQFMPGQDDSYAAVFARADRLMYDDKREYYRTVGDRRRPRSTSGEEE